jgi:hypothetical protein
MNFADVKNVGANIDAAFVGYVSATAGGAGDAAEVNGPWIDRRGHDSCAVFIGYRCTLAAAATLSIAANLQDANDAAGALPADFGKPMPNGVRHTGAGTNVTGVLKLNFDLTMARSHIRLQFTPDLSAGTVDTAVLFAMIVFGPGQTAIQAPLNP